ncbi:N-acetylmuramoyl-L-alanine amidase AmiC [termite gut metagenome]|uniref:N-acetylmuramoyl-L-alanine amidase AmiC n=1 Tax=termite gut metagenome TaxID=433724 RepID=A0A5J4Q4Y0_9ZZZZ
MKNNGLELLFNFVVTSFKISLQMTLSWLIMLILSMTLIMVEYYIMKLRKYYMRFLIVCLTLSIFSFSDNNAWAKNFVLVIDPGHGGHDPGAIGKISKEKNINLNVALKLGNLIKANCEHVKIVYTRSTDVFIPLDRRAEIANNAKADLFISIHTNALKGKKLVQGASTWTLGLARSEENLEVAKRENAVMFYETDYKTRYAGFDPNSSESYIIFEFIQDKYMMQSVRLASLIQQQFGRVCNR